MIRFGHMRLQWRLQSLDLRAKILMILIGVIVPTFLIGIVAQNRITRPFLENDLGQIGITVGQNFANEILASKIVGAPDFDTQVDLRIQEILARQPQIVRIDIIGRDEKSGQLRILASNFEENPTKIWTQTDLLDKLKIDRVIDEAEIPNWEIFVPIQAKPVAGKPQARPLAMVRLLVTLKGVGAMLETSWRINGAMALVSMVSLITALSFFLRRTIDNDRKLREARFYNLHLTEQLEDARRTLMNTEKLAVMGQLTASFAHEIGTPLNAMSGHLQLLKDEVEPEKVPQKSRDRLDVILGQVEKIESIVKGFLQSTSKPPTQKQLVDLNTLAQKTVGIVRPRIDALALDCDLDLDRDLSPVRVAPIDVEQILLNLVNNSLDSLSEKSRASFSRGKLKLTSRRLEEEGRTWAEIEVFDTGVGIEKEDLKKIFKPFYTTKAPGSGTGLGLTICRQLAERYGGDLMIDSKSGAWTRATLRVPV